MNELSERFAFGQNWTHFLSTITEENVNQATERLRKIAGELRGKTFLDVGCGSGIHSLAALRLGASRVVAFDYDPASVAATRQLQIQTGITWKAERGSALDESYLRSLGQFDVVYSWGVLHHTGDMWKALDLVTIPCKHTLVVAIYNDQGWQSRMWRQIKRRYVNSGRTMQKAIEIFTFAALWGGSLAYHTVRLKPSVTVRKWREYSKNRGMSPWIDVVDWAGGYPFEVARPQDVIAFYNQRGFALISSTLTRRNGCNEFVFNRS